MPPLDPDVADLAPALMPIGMSPRATWSRSPAHFVPVNNAGCYLSSGTLPGLGLPGTVCMRRREFIILLGGGVTAWPHSALAQVLTKRPPIAWLSGGERTASWVFVEAFLQGMR